ARRARGRDQPDVDRTDGGHDPRAQRAGEDVPDRRAQHAVRARAVRPGARARAREDDRQRTPGCDPARSEGPGRLSRRRLRDRADRGGEGLMLLRLQGVIAGYGGGDVLQGVDLEIAPGSIACIVGPNGAGKSTVLKTVSGLLRPREGAVTMDGAELHRLSP